MLLTGNAVLPIFLQTPYPNWLSEMKFIYIQFIHIECIILQPVEMINK